jgi:uncharacterized membrane protein YkoI
MLPRKILSRTLLALVLLGGVGVVHADDDADRARAGAQSGRLLPLTRILQIVATRYPGEVLAVELDDDDRPEYELRVLQRDGRILEIEIDARTGRFLDVDEDD